MSLRGACVMFSKCVCAMEKRVQCNVFKAKRTFNF